jgi:hypothetical protein
MQLRQRVFSLLSARKARSFLLTCSNALLLAIAI